MLCSRHAAAAAAARRRGERHVYRPVTLIRRGQLRRDRPLVLVAVVSAVVRPRGTRAVIVIVVIAAAAVIPVAVNALGRLRDVCLAVFAIVVAERLFLLLQSLAFGVAGVDLLLADLPRRDPSAAPALDLLDGSAVRTLDLTLLLFPAAVTIAVSVTLTISIASSGGSCLGEKS